MTRKRYSINESLRRLVRLFRGEILADDSPTLYEGEAAWDESLSDLVELAQSSYPGVTGVIPVGLLLQAVHFNSGEHLLVHQQGIGPQRIGTGANYTQFDGSGTWTLVGAATAFDDISAQLTPDKQGANNKPDYDYTNLGLLFPQNDATESIQVIIQFSHSKKLNTVIYPHLHYIQAGTGTPIFEYYYRWYSNGGHVPSVWFTGSTVDGSRGIFSYTSGSMLQIAAFPAVTPPMGDEGVSSNFEIVLWRNDNIVSGDVLVKYYDIHYEVDTAGSDTQYTK